MGVQVQVPSHSAFSGVTQIWCDDDGSGISKLSKHHADHIRTPQLALATRDLRAHLPGVPLILTSLLRVRRGLGLRVIPKGGVGILLNPFSQREPSSQLSWEMGILLGGGGLGWAGTRAVSAHP